MTRDYSIRLRELKVFQNADITKPAPLTREERMQIAKFRLFRDRIHEGPLYTVLGDDARVGKHQSWAAASSDPFEGMPTYSQKYARKRRRVPKLDTRPYGMIPEHVIIFVIC